MSSKEMEFALVYSKRVSSQNWATFFRNLKILKSKGSLEPILERIISLGTKNRIQDFHFFSHKISKNLPGILALIFGTPETPLLVP